ncbi:hypothetical protein PF011_g33105, partial [Phytophthora fragariae]
ALVVVSFSNDSSEGTFELAVGHVIVLAASIEDFVYNRVVVEAPRNSTPLAAKVASMKALTPSFDNTPRCSTSNISNRNRHFSSSSSADTRTASTIMATDSRDKGMNITEDLDGSSYPVPQYLTVLCEALKA